MQVLLLKTVATLGNPGELVEIKPGYARNYLVPQGFAIVATPKNIKAFTHQQKTAEMRRRKFLDDVRVLAAEIGKSKITFVEKVGPHGKLYGAVTNRMVAAELSARTGGDIDRRKVILEEAIHEPGEYDITIRLDRDVQVVLKVVVEGELVVEAETVKTQFAANISAAPEPGEEEDSSESADDTEAAK